MSVYGSRIVFCNPTLAMREVFKDKVDFTGWLVVQRWRWGSFRPCDHDATATALPWLITSKHWLLRSTDRSLGRLWWDQAVGPGRRAEPRAALAADERPHRLRRCEARRVPLAVRARGAVQEGQADVPMDHRGLLHENGTPIVRRSGDVVPADVANAILLLVHSRAIGAAL